MDKLFSIFVLVKEGWILAASSADKELLEEVLEEEYPHDIDSMIVEIPEELHESTVERVTSWFIFNKLN